MTEAAQRKAVPRPASRLPVSRPVLWTGIAVGAFLAGEALLHRLVLPLGLPGFVGAAITAVLIVALAVVVAELTRRHHRTVAGHAIRHGKRGAAASARHARRHGGTALQWLVSKASPRWEKREHWPLMFRKVRGEHGNGQHITPSTTITEGTSPMTTSPSYKGGDFSRLAGSRGSGAAGSPAGGSRIAPEHRARRAAARTGGGSMPSEWGPVIAQTADFEPEDDGELLEWMSRQVTGLSAWAEALVDFYEHCTGVVGIDPKASAMLHDVADAAAAAAETMGAAKAKFTEHYELPREFAANGGLMTHDGRWVTGEGA